MEKFKDRIDAGKLLAEKLSAYKNHPDALVLALPRGGVPIGFEIAQDLALPLDVFIVRKLGVPGHDELAMGAIASGGIALFNEAIIQELGISKHAIKHVMEAEKEELQRREIIYRGTKSSLQLKNKTILLVDDGIATGATVKAAIRAIRAQQPKKIVLAVPVAARATSEELAKEVEEVVCLLKPVHFYAVGMWYECFAQTSDEEVIDLLKRVNEG